MQHLGGAIEKNANDRVALVKMLRAVRLGNEIFLSLNTYGMSETIEGQMDAWMQVFHKWLSYTNPILKETDPDKEAAQYAPLSEVFFKIKLFYFWML